MVLIVVPSAGPSMRSTEAIATGDGFHHSLEFWKEEWNEAEKEVTKREEWWARTFLKL